MKEQIYTIPMNDAFALNDECPFCHLERKAERHAIDFALGSQASYMEDDFRMQTDKTGFCRAHYKMMYDYGNRLGSALILSTHMKKFNEELTKEMKSFSYPKSSFTDKFKTSSVSCDEPAKTELGKWLDAKEEDCFICNHFHNLYDQYMNTFFYMYKKMPEFVEIFKHSNGFCVPHFRDLIEVSATKLNDKQKEEFYPVLFELMEKNLERIRSEVNVFIDKNDYYRGQNLEWGNAKDSVQRAMQKLAGGYPADGKYEMKK